MTRSDFIIKWGVYTLALVPVWILELYVLSRYPLFGVKPMLLPLAVVAVAVLEGSTAGGGFGLFVGVLCDACYHDTFGGMTLGLCLVGVCAGAVSRYALRQNLLGCLLCSCPCSLCFRCTLWSCGCSNGCPKRPCCRPAGSGPPGEGEKMGPHP